MVRPRLPVRPGLIIYGEPGGTRSASHVSSTARSADLLPACYFFFRGFFAAGIFARAVFGAVFRAVVFFGARFVVSAFFAGIRTPSVRMSAHAQGEQSRLLLQA